MRARRQQQSGFALLFVFLMSAAVGIMLYRQLPRVAFESVRAKEEILVEQGEQFQRAIQLYTAAIKKYPQDIDDLEKTNNRRFLRKRYKDPFTGKDDWRLIHVDAAGALTDSKIKKKEEKKPNQNTFVSEFAGIGQTQNSGTAGVNVALRRRPSENAVESGPAALALPSSQEPLSQADLFAQFQKQQEALQKKQQQQQQQRQQQQGQPGQVPNPMMPGGQPQIGPDGRPIVQAQGQLGQLPQGQPGQVPGQTPGQVPGQVNMPQAYPNGVPQYPGAVGVGQQQPAYPGGTAQSGRTGLTGMNAMTGPGMTGPGMTSPGAPGAAPNQALDMIRNALTSPSPNMPMNMGPGASLGPGIAGVASKHEAPAIKIYNEQQEYDKWEFIYDVRKDKRVQQQLAAAGGAQPGQQPGQQIGTPMGGPGTGINQGQMPGGGMNQGMNPGMNQGMNVGGQRVGMGAGPGMMGNPGMTGNPGMAGNPGMGIQPSQGIQPAQGNTYTQPTRSVSAQPPIGSSPQTLSPLVTGGVPVTQPATVPGQPGQPENANPQTVNPETGLPIPGAPGSTIPVQQPVGQPVEQPVNPEPQDPQPQP